jgi:hypothetical protein
MALVSTLFNFTFKYVTRKLHWVHSQWTALIYSDLCTMEWSKERIVGTEQLFFHGKQYLKHSFHSCYDFLISQTINNGVKHGGANGVEYSQNLFFSSVHMCIQCLGHFSSLHPAPSLTPCPLPLSPTTSLPGRNYFTLISKFVEERV